MIFYDGFHSGCSGDWRGGSAGQVKLWLGLPPIITREVWTYSTKVFGNISYNLPNQQTLEWESGLNLFGNIWPPIICLLCKLLFKSASSYEEMPASADSSARQWMHRLSRTSKHRPAPAALCTHSDPVIGLFAQLSVESKTPKAGFSHCRSINTSCKRKCIPNVIHGGRSQTNKSLEP